MPQTTEYLQQASTTFAESLRQARTIHEDSIEVLRDLTAVLLPLGVVAAPGAGRILPVLDDAVQRGFDAIAGAVGSQYDLAGRVLERIVPAAA
ncbi:MAG: hypothetical protein E6J20_21275 [Chloroflexi bacterium]|nr:MAG: hypothetical protein E6J20_21275 [Chloroflexota bacterium]